MCVCVSVRVLPALTVTALTNCSLQLLLPTTKARFVFLISLSTVLCMHTITHTSTQAHTNPQNNSNNKQRRKAQKAGANTPRPPVRPGETRPTRVLMYTKRRKCFRLAEAHLKSEDFFTVGDSAKLLLINATKLAERLPEKVRKKTASCLVFLFFYGG